MREIVNVPKNRTIAIASGKGGVGKTVITANLALGLARQFSEQRDSVVAIDLDLGCGNLNACLGVRSPNGTINSYFLKKAATLQQVLTPTEERNLQMICSSYSGLPEIQLADGLKRELLDEIRGLGANFVLMDLAAGTSADVLDLFLGASQRIIVITPESLSLHNAFVFLKTAILRFLSRQLEREDFPATVKLTWQETVGDPEHINIRESIERIRSWDRYTAYVLNGLIRDLKIKFVVNMYQGGSDKSHLKNFHHLLFKYLCMSTNISYLGFVHLDNGVRRSVQGIKPFLLHYPHSPAAKDIWEVAERLAGENDLDSPPPLRFPEEVKPFFICPPQNPAAENTLEVAEPLVEGLNNYATGDTQQVSESLAPDGHGTTDIKKVVEPTTEKSDNGAGKDILEVAACLTENPDNGEAKEILEVAKRLAVNTC